MAGFAGTGLWFLASVRVGRCVRCRLPGWRLRPAKREERREVIRPQFHAPGDECSSSMNVSGSEWPGGLALPDDQRYLGQSCELARTHRRAGQETSRTWTLREMVRARRLTLRWTLGYSET